MEELGHVCIAPLKPQDQLSFRPEVCVDAFIEYIELPMSSERGTALLSASARQQCYPLHKVSGFKEIKFLNH